MSKSHKKPYGSLETQWLLALGGKTTGVGFSPQYLFVDSIVLSL
jgi:hypothetical protein